MRQGCVAVMSTTWIASVAIFGALVLPRGGYYFNGSGLLACDPFFARASLRYFSPVHSWEKERKRNLSQLNTFYTNAQTLKTGREGSIRLIPLKPLKPWQNHPKRTLSYSMETNLYYTILYLLQNIKTVAHQKKKKRKRNVHHLGYLSIQIALCLPGWVLHVRSICFIENVFSLPLHKSVGAPRQNGGNLLCFPLICRILACCCFYFPTTMVLMYCYGSAFHVNKLRLKRVVCVNTPEVVSGGHMERVSQVCHHSNLCPIDRLNLKGTRPANKTATARLTIRAGLLDARSDTTLNEVAFAPTGWWRDRSQ